MSRYVARSHLARYLRTGKYVHRTSISAPEDDVQPVPLMREQISKIAPSLEQIREILEACVYRGKDAEESTNPELLGMCSLEELQVCGFCT